MTVTGSTSAEIAASTYVPPYKATTSYAQTPEVTGSVTSALPVDPTVAASATGADYATAYLDAHRMSWSSYRYIYLLWFVLAVLTLLYALSHHVRLSGGSLGATYSKWGIKRRAFGTATAGGRRTVLPSNNLVLSVLVLVVVSVVLSVIGPDYIRPSASTFNYAATRKRSFVAYSISKSFWTSGNRFGDMAFALMPLVVLFALKAPPFAAFSLRYLTHLYNDKLALFHRGAAWLVWGVTTVHTVLWTIQLFKDQHNGKAVWFAAWSSYHFIFGCIAYGCMTALMALSLKPIRKNGYELFYLAHVVLVAATIACSAIHHPVLWYWMAAAGGLWVCERTIRFLRMSRINGLFGKSKYGSLVAGKPYDENTFRLQEIKRSSHYIEPSQQFTNPYDKTLPSAPNMSRSNSQPLDDFGHRGQQGFYDEGSFQAVGSYEARHSNPHSPPQPQGAFPGTPERSHSVATNIPRNFPVYTPTVIPIGCAQAQLLPSRTVRLTIRVARPFHWAPGQSVLLYLPELSWFQSHPFTILNNDPTEIMLLVKARKGLTRNLYDLVRQRSLAAVGVNNVKDKRMSLASMQTGRNNLHVPPIFLKARVDGPMGSSERVRWKEHSTVLIVCGGSGVSFGTSVCEYVCTSIRNGLGRTKRVRFCWVVREYAEIAWVAGLLRRCQDMVSADQLQIDIFVTNARKAQGDFELPRPVFARADHSRAGSVDSAMSEMSVNPHADVDEVVDSTLDASYADVIDLTNYEDEEDMNDPAENQLSNKLEEQGKIRRARSRRVAKKRSSRMPYSQPTSYPPTRVQGLYDPALNHEEAYSALSAPPGRTSPGSSVYNPFHDGQAPHGYSSAAMSPSNSHSMLPPSASFASFSGHNPRQSIHSVANSTYSMGDLYGGGSIYNPPDSPSMGHTALLDDVGSIYGADATLRDPRELSQIRDALSRTSRTQSMVLLENGSTDPTADAGLWVDESDYAAMDVMSEMARAGKPKLSAVMEEEIELAQGSIIVATCGPVTLNTVVRNLVSKNISPSRIRHGDTRGRIVVYSEDYEG
ncbi:hypothetical protein IAR50_007145 [Cryptococcus sp. DSM 104548]